MNCTKCGAELKENANFCTECGAKREKVEYVVAEPVVIAGEQAEPNVYDKTNVVAIVLLVASITCQCNIISAILAIISLVRSNAAKALYHSGDLRGAAWAHESKKKCNMWGWIIFGIFVVLEIAAAIFIEVVIALLGLFK